MRRFVVEVSLVVGLILAAALATSAVAGFAIRVFRYCAGMTALSLSLSVVLLAATLPGCT